MRCALKKMPPAMQAMPSTICSQTISITCTASIIRLMKKYMSAGVSIRRQLSFWMRQKSCQALGCA